MSITTTSEAEFKERLERRKAEEDRRQEVKDVLTDHRVEQRRKAEQKKDEYNMSGHYDLASIAKEI